MASVFRMLKWCSLIPIHLLGKKLSIEKYVRGATKRGRKSREVVCEQRGLPESMTTKLYENLFLTPKRVVTEILDW